MKLNQENGDRKKTQIYLNYNLLIFLNKTLTIKQEKTPTKHKITCMDLS